VKDFLHLLRRTEAGLLPRYYPALLSVLPPMAGAGRTTTGPAVFWHCDGRACGLKLPPMERWPTGYTFYTWLRAEGRSSSPFPHARRVHLHMPSRRLAHAHTELTHRL
jgi:hypothetical protein